MTQPPWPLMAQVDRRRFDAAAFPASAGLGRRIIQLAPKDALYTQGDPADSVFYLQKGRAKVTVLSAKGRKLLSHFSPTVTSWEKRRSRQWLEYVWQRRVPLVLAQLSKSAGKK